MGKIDKRAVQDRIPLQVYEWFVRMKTDDAKPVDVEAFNHWAKQNPELAGKLPELESFWRELDRMEINQILSLNHANDEKFTTIAKHRLQQLIFDVRHSFWAKPAVIAVCVIGVFLTLQITTHQSPSKSVIHETARAERKVVNLPDGSIVHLNVLTAIEVEYTTQRRRIFLRQGEAFFSVVSNNDRPMIVAFNHGAVYALGTAFDVKMLSPGVAQVTLMDGAVRIDDGSGQKTANSTILNKAGEQALIESIDKLQVVTSNTLPNPIKITKTSNVDVNNVLAWQEGKLIFTGQRLAYVIDEINKHASHYIRLQDTETARKPVFAVFNAGDWENALHAIEKSYRLKAININPETTLLVNDPTSHE